MPRYKVTICQFPGGNSTHPDVADWVTETAIKMRLDPRIGEGNVSLWRLNDTPVTMSRNRALLAAERDGADFVLMVDSDMSPDLPGVGAKPFWDTAWEFALASKEPCVIAAPYCGPPPFEMPYIFRFTNQAGDHPQPDFQITAFSRAECATMTGMVRAAALPTGLMLIDMRAVKKLPHPRFYYEWKGDGPVCGACGCRKGGVQVEKASTEDVAFSRDLYVLGVPLWAAMSSWAGHHKVKLVGKPQLIPDDAIPAAMMARAEVLVRERMERERVEREKLYPLGGPSRGTYFAAPLPSLDITDVGRLATLDFTVDDPEMADRLVEAVGSAGGVPAVAVEPKVERKPWETHEEYGNPVG